MRNFWTNVRLTEASPIGPVLTRPSRESHAMQLWSDGGAGRRGRHGPGAGRVGRGGAGDQVGADPPSVGVEREARGRDELAGVGRIARLNLIAAAEHGLGAAARVLGRSADGGQEGQGRIAHSDVAAHTGGPWAPGAAR